MLAFLKRMITVPKSPMRLIASWFFSCSLFEILRPYVLLSNGLFVLITAGVFLILTVMQALLSLPRLTPGALAVSALTYAFVLVCTRLTSRNDPLFLLVLLAVALVLFPLLHKESGRLLPLTVSKRLSITVCLAAGVLCAGVIGTITCLRYVTFSAPNFDFGIFCNMFHHMSETLLPTVSCERNQLLSHFAVHISPIYYLILPFYWLFPSPLTLQIAQAVIVASGILPLYRLARHFKLSPTVTAVLGVLYAAYPPLTTGCFYDIHENCFLAPLLLWVFALYEEQRYRWMILPACLVLATKEDAAVYLAFFAMYLLFSRRDGKRGLPLMLAAAVYFAVAVVLLELYGQGAMFGRYTALLTTEKDTGGLLGTLLRDPAFFLTQIADGKTVLQKLQWLLELLLPLGLLLWMPRGKYSRLWLLAPLLLNLLTQYRYMFHSGFQYSFGSIAFLFYLLVQNAADNPPHFRRNHLLFALITALLMYTMTVIPTLTRYAVLYRENHETYARMEALLDTVPDDASVIASTWLIPHLADRTEIYESTYHAVPDTDYVVLDRRTAASDAYRDLALDRGYTVVTGEEDLLIILKAPT